MLLKVIKSKVQIFLWSKQKSRLRKAIKRGFDRYKENTHKYYFRFGSSKLAFGNWNEIVEESKFSADEVFQGLVNSTLQKPQKTEINEFFVVNLFEGQHIVVAIRHIGHGIIFETIPVSGPFSEWHAEHIVDRLSTCFCQ